MKRAFVGPLVALVSTLTVCCSTPVDRDWVEVIVKYEADGQGGCGGQGGSPPEGDAGMPPVEAPECPQAQVSCLTRPIDWEFVSGEPCWADSHCNRWGGCMSFHCQGYFGDPSAPGWCIIEPVVEPVACGSVGGETWRCSVDGECCPEAVVFDTLV